MIVHLDVAETLQPDIDERKYVLAFSAQILDYTQAACVCFKS